MQIRLFTIPVGGSGAAVQEMDAFLRGNKILEVENQFVSNEHGAYWCFCVRYIERAYPEADGKKAAKVDYRKLLDEATFQKFAKLREVRKKTISGISSRLPHSRFTLRNPDKTFNWRIYFCSESSPFATCCSRSMIERMARSGGSLLKSARIASTTTSGIWLLSSCPKSNLPMSINRPGIASNTSQGKSCLLPMLAGLESLGLQKKVRNRQDLQDLQDVVL